jgi:AcrR family transcriptional regulator
VGVAGGECPVGHCFGVSRQFGFYLCGRGVPGFVSEKRQQPLCHVVVAAWRILPHRYGSRPGPGVRRAVGDRVYPQYRSEQYVPIGNAAVLWPGFRLYVSGRRASCAHGPPPQNKNAKRSEEGKCLRSTRDLILDAALELFSENGYSETTMREIANNVGIKSASIYNHFSGKSEILLCLMDEYKQNILNSVLPIEEIDQLIDEKPAIEILRRLFFRFNENNEQRMVKILKVIYHEQYRVDEARSYVKNIQFDFMIDYIRQTLGKLIDAKKVREIDIISYAHMLVYVVTCAGYRTMLYHFEDYQKLIRVSSAEILEMIFDSIVID